MRLRARGRFVQSLYRVIRAIPVGYRDCLNACPISSGQHTASARALRAQNVPGKLHALLTVRQGYLKHVVGAYKNFAAAFLLACALIAAPESFSADNDAIHSLTFDPVTGKRRVAETESDGSPPATAVPLTIVAMALKLSATTGKSVTADQIFTLVKGIKAAKGKATIEPIAKALAELIGENGFKALEKDAVLNLDELMIQLTLREKDKAPTDADEIERINVLKDEIEKVRSAGGTKSAPPKSTSGAPKTIGGAPPKRGGGDEPPGPPKNPVTETPVPIDTPTIAPVPTDLLDPGIADNIGDILDNNDNDDNDNDRNNRNKNNKNNPDVKNQKANAGDQPENEQSPQTPSGGGGGGGGEPRQQQPGKAGEPQSVTFGSLTLQPGPNDINLDMSKAGPRDADTDFISKAGDSIVEMMNGYGARLQAIIKTGERFVAGINNGRQEKLTTTVPTPVAKGATLTRASNSSVGAAVNAAMGGGRVLPSRVQAGRTGGAGTTDASNGVPMVRGMLGR